MRNILLGTTALVAVAALAAPAMAAEKIQLELRGYHIGGITYTDGEFNDFWRNQYTGGHGSSSGISDYNEINFGSDSEIHFRGATTLDNGLKVSFFAELELEDNSDVDSDADQIDEVYIQFDGGFGRFQFGQNDGAMYQMHVQAPTTFDGHKVNNNGPRLDPFAPLGWGSMISTYGNFTDDHIKLSYFSPSFNGFQLGLSYTPNPCKNDTGYSSCVYDGFGRNYFEASATFEIAMDNVEFGFSAGIGGGESNTSGSEPTEWTAGAQAAFGGFTIGGSYKDSETAGYSNWDETQFDVGVTYETGPWGFTINYADMDRDYRDGAYRYNDEANAWLAGVTYMYGPGMQVGFGIQTLDATDVMRDTEYTWDGSQWYSYTWGEGFEGTSFFIENSMSF